MTKIQKTILIIILLLASFLRFYRLDQVPPSLFSDEVDLGYQGYSILKTGRDYSGNPFPTNFQSFADFRAPLYIYASIPTLAIFGLNEWGVRLPAAFFGMVSLVGMFLLVRKLTVNTWIALCSAFLLAISPWHLQYSRAGFEVTLMMSLLVWGTLLFLVGFKNKFYLGAGIILILMAIYSYSPAKLFVPLLVTGLIIIYKKQLLKLPGKFKLVLLAVLLLVMLPFLVDLFKGQATYRFSYTSIFSDPTVSKEIDVNRSIDSKKTRGSIGVEANLISKISHNKILSLNDAFLKNYLYSYSTNFLFLQGDIIGRHSVGKMGEFYLIEFITMITGLFYLAKKATPETVQVTVLWVLAAPIPAALTVDGGGHATRLFLLLVPLILVSSLGAYSLASNLSKMKKLKKMLLFALMAMFILNVYTYFHRYYVHYVSEQERLWHYGFKQAISKAQALNNNFDKIVFTNTTEPPLIFVLFWTKFDPATFQNLRVEKATLPGFGSDAPKIGKYYLTNINPGIETRSIAEYVKPDMLVIANRKDISLDLRREQIKGIKVVDLVEYPSGEVAFYLLTHD